MQIHTLGVTDAAITYSGFSRVFMILRGPLLLLFQVTLSVTKPRTFYKNTSDQNLSLITSITLEVHSYAKI